MCHQLSRFFSKPALHHLSLGSLPRGSRWLTRPGWLCDPALFASTSLCCVAFPCKGKGEPCPSPAPLPCLAGCPLPCFPRLGLQHCQLAPSAGGAVGEEELTLTGRPEPELLEPERQHCPLPSTLHTAAWLSTRPGHVPVCEPGGSEAQNGKLQGGAARGQHRSGRRGL